MAALTNVGEEQILKWLSNQSPTAPVLPFKVRLVTVLGTDTAAGTAATGPQSSPQTCIFAAPFLDGDGDYAMSNNAILRFEELNAQTIVGSEIIDSTATPVRWAHGALNASVAVVAGAPFEFAVGEVKWKFR